MVDYQSLYHKMFNACTDAVELIAAGNADAARELLITAQQDCEEAYIGAN